MTIGKLCIGIKSSLFRKGVVVRTLDFQINFKKFPPIRLHGTGNYIYTPGSHTPTLLGKMAYPPKQIHRECTYSTYVYEITTVRGKVAAMAASLCTQYSIEPKVAGFA